MAAAAVLPPWPHAAAATQTCVRIDGDKPIIRITLNRSRKHPCSVSVRLHSDLILSHVLRRIDGRYVVLATDPVIRALDHRVVVAYPAALRWAETWSELIHKMLAVAPATAEYDLAADNWLDSISSPEFTPHGIAMAIVNRFGEQINEVIRHPGGVLPGLDFDVHLPGLWVTLLYSEPKALLLACKEANAAAKTEDAGAPAPGRKRRHESSEPCAICLLDVDTRDEETVGLPCSHAFHTGCIGTWFHRASTCPTCRHDIMDCFSFVRAESAEQSVDR